ncbi:MAG TPA: hypothetical protein DHW17_01710 [Nitrospina sp.]|nr:hypothetical protein [Nitrospina sp.]
MHSLQNFHLELYGFLNEVTFIHQIFPACRKIPRSPTLCRLSVKNSEKATKSCIFFTILTQLKFQPACSTNTYPLLFKVLFDLLKNRAEMTVYGI